MSIEPSTSPHAGSNDFALMREAWRILNSSKVAILLLSVIAVASMVGVVLPQNLPHSVYVEKFGRGARLILATGANDVYHTTWFISLLGFFCFDILLCTIRRAVSLSRSPRRGMGFARGLGSVITHLSIILILLGGMYSGMAGFRTQKAAFPGESIDIPGTSAELRLDEFEIERNDEGAIRQFRSSVSLVDSSGAITQHEILVNHPLTHRGVSMYQNSYGQMSDKIESGFISISEGQDKEPIGAISLPFGEKTEMIGTGLSVLVKKFACDFVMDVESGEVANRSAEHNNPAVYVELYRGDKLVQSGWSFYRLPGMHSKEQLFDILFIDYEPIQYSVFEIAKAPGVPLVYSGFGAASIGLILSLILPGTRVRRNGNRAKGNAG